MSLTFLASKLLKVQIQGLTCRHMAKYETQGRRQHSFCREITPPRSFKEMKLSKDKREGAFIGK